MSTDPYPQRAMTGYDRDDPKRPDWAELQLDAADDARKADRENGIPNRYVEAWKREQEALAVERGRCVKSNSEFFRCVMPVGHDGGCFLVPT